MVPAQKNPDPDPTQPSPMAEAMRWVSVVTSVSLEMVVPALVGAWIDRSLGSSFAVWIGLVLGPILGFWHLMVLTGVSGSGKSKSEKPEDR